MVIAKDGTFEPASHLIDEQIDDCHILFNTETGRESAINGDRSNSK